MNVWQKVPQISLWFPLYFSSLNYKYRKLTKTDLSVLQATFLHIKCHLLGGWLCEVAYLYPYAGWPRKNATTLIINFKDIVNKKCVFFLFFFNWVENSFSNKNDTMTINFGWGIWILGLFQRGNVVFQIRYILEQQAFFASLRPGESAVA